jgi:hypothetical protein
MRPIGMGKAGQTDSVSERKCFSIEAEVKWLFSKHGFLDSVQQAMRIVRVVDVTRWQGRCGQGC